MSDITHPFDRHDEQQLVSLLDYISNGLILVNRGGIVVYCNAEVEALLGYTSDALLGRRFDKLLLTEHRLAHQQHFSRFIKDKQSRQMGFGKAFPALHRNGKTVHVSIGLKRIERGGLVYILATLAPAQRLQDVTESLKQSESNLSVNINERKRLMQVAESSPDAVFLLDAKHRITWLNVMAKNLLSDSQDTLVGSDILDICSDVRRSNSSVSLSDSLKSVISFSGEVALRSGATKALKINVNLQPVFDGDLLQGYYFTARDVTNQKKLEEQLREHNELLETTARIAKLGFYSLDIAHNYLHWSEETFNIHELPTNTKIDVEDALNYYAPEARPVIAHAVEKCIETGQPFDLELPFITAKKRRIWVRAVGYAEFKNGKPTKLKGAFQDITRLRKAASDAEQANIAKSRFLANMSHELRTPITGLIGVADLLSNSKLDDKQSEYLQVIDTSAQSLLFLVNQVLDYAKLESGAQALEAAQFHLYNMLRDVTHLHSISAKKKDCRFHLSVDSDVPSLIWGDEHRLAQVMHNLCSNAVKFTHEGEITVRVTRNGARQLKVEVRDTGIGIKKADITKLFQEFRQLDNSYNRKYQGTGLGLSITRQLVILMGGTIHVESEYGEGSCFWFTFGIDNDNEADSPNLKSNAADTIALFSERSSVEAWLKLSQSINTELMASSSVSDLIHTIKNNKQIKHILVVGVSDENPVATVLHSIIRIVSPSQRILINDELIEQASLGDLNGNINVTEIDLSASLSSDGVSYKTEAVYHQVCDWLYRNPVQSNINLANKRILVVEDNEINQLLFADMLVATGARVFKAFDGKQGLDTIQRNHKPFDLVIMDCQMPVMDGFTATELIRANPKSEINGLTIVAATAHGFDGDIQRCYDVGMNDVLVKPFTRQQLYQALSRNIKNG